MPQARSLRYLIPGIFAVAAIGFGFVYFSDNSDGGGATEPTTAHEKMKAELADIASTAGVDNEYYQNATTEEAKAKLAALPANQIGQRINLLYQIFLDEVRLGQERIGVERIEEVQALIRKHNISLRPQQQRDFLFAAGIGWLRVGETENCVHCLEGESCILPISEKGQHTNREGSTKAIEYFLKVLDKEPDHRPSLWLLNIAAMTLGDYPKGVPKPYRLPEAAFQSDVDFPRFPDTADKIGLKTINTSGGIVAEDFDNDGFIDVLTSDWAPNGQLRYFRNTGDGQFEERTEQAGLTGILGGINMVQADYNNDGLVDVYLMRGAWLDSAGRHPNSLLKNLGDNKFADVTFDVGLETRHPSASAAWADYDNDGDVDLYAPNEDNTAQLFRNDGENGFVDVTLEAGVSNNLSAKGAVWGDYDGDRFPDLFISNVEGNNRLYRNQQDGTFKDTAPQLGLTAPLVSFPTWFWDANGDGHLDIFVASYHVDPGDAAAEALGLPYKDEPDCLYLNDGQGNFVESAADFGLTQKTTPMGANFGDLNNDGRPDFYLGTGFPAFSGLIPNLMFLNQSGRGFKDVTFPGGFGMLQKGHAIAFADFDNDGDLDVFAQTGGAYPGDAFGNVLFDNPGFDNHWLRIKLVGETSNRCGIGCRIRAVITEDGQPRSIYHWVNSGGSFGANPLVPQIGLGAATTIETLEIFWPTTGETQTFNNVDVDQFVQVRESATDLEPLPLKPTKAGAEE